MALAPKNKLFARTLEKGRQQATVAQGQLGRDIEPYTRLATQAGLQAITPQVRGGLANVQGYLGSAPAPLAGSGAALALQRSVLAPALQGLTSQVAGGAGDLLQQLIRRRVEERYKMAEEKRNKKGGGVGGVVGGIAGAVGGPALSTIGSRIGSSIF